MSDYPDDDSDAWFDQLRESLPEPEPGLPGPDAVPEVPSRSGPSWRSVLLAVLALVVVGLVVIGRADVWMMRLGAIAIVVGAAPRWLGRGTEVSLTADVATRVSREASARAKEGRGWKWGAGGQAGLVVLAGLATGYTYDAYAASPAADLRDIPLRWSGLLACFAVATGVLLIEARRSEAARREATALIEELELDSVEEPTRSPLAALLLTSLFAMGAAFAIPRALAPENRDDSPARVLVLGPQAESHARWLRSRFGLDAHAKTLDVAWSDAEQRFDGERGQFETLTHLADLEGFGFMLVDFEALPMALAERPDVELASPVPATPTFAAFATGDVIALEHYVWSGRGRSRPEWAALGPNPATLGQADSWIEGQAAEHLALARALFAQPAFRESTDDYFGPEPLPPLTSKNYTLIRGIVFFDLPPAFWADALDTYQDIESMVGKHRVPPLLRDDP